MSQPLADFYDSFLNAVLDRDGQALAPYLTEPALADTARVYRNTIYRGAVDVLASGYPSVCAILGMDYFEGLASTYVDSRPTVRRTLVGYGEDFPLYLGRLEGMHHLPYLADIAHLDRLWLEAHLSADDKALHAADITHLDGNALADLNLLLHPSVRIGRIGWNLFEVWAAHRAQDGSELTRRAITPVASIVLVWRFDNTVCFEPLSAGNARFLSALANGDSLGVAASLGAEEDPDFDASAAFAHFLQSRIFSSIREQTELEHAP